jgi:hypothetical protein
MTRLARAADFCSAVLVSTEETRKAFANLGVATWLVPEAGIHQTAFPRRHARQQYRWDRLGEHIHAVYQHVLG